MFRSLRLGCFVTDYHKSNPKMDPPVNLYYTHHSFLYLSVSPVNTAPTVDGVDCGASASRWLQQLFGKDDMSLVLITQDISLRPSERGSELGHTDHMQVGY